MTMPVGQLSEFQSNGAKLTISCQMSLTRQSDTVYPCEKLADTEDHIKRADFEDLFDDIDDPDIVDPDPVDPDPVDPDPVDPDPVDPDPVDPDPVDPKKPPKKSFSLWDKIDRNNFLFWSVIVQQIFNLTIMGCSSCLITLSDLFDIYYFAFSGVHSFKKHGLQVSLLVTSALVNTFNDMNFCF